MSQRLRQTAFHRRYLCLSLHSLWLLTFIVITASALRLSLTVSFITPLRLSRIALLFREMHPKSVCLRIITRARALFRATRVWDFAVLLRCLAVQNSKMTASALKTRRTLPYSFRLQPALSTTRQCLKTTATMH